MEELWRSNHTEWFTKASGRKKSGLTMKKHMKIPEVRILPETIKNRMNSVRDINKQEIDFTRYIFIEEAKLNLHI